MTRRGITAACAVVAVAMVLVLAVAFRNAFPVDIVVTANAASQDCLKSAADAAPVFCVDLRPPSASAEPASPIDSPALLDQLPACGRRGGMAPSFCVELEFPSASVVRQDQSSPSHSSGNPCAQLAPSEAPIFCLSALVPAGPDGRQAAIRYLAEQGGLNTRDANAVGVHLEIETLIGSADAERLRKSSQADREAVESYFGRRFATPPTIFVLATRSSYARALRQLLGYEAEHAAVLATQTGGLYVSDPSVVFVNWENVRVGPLLVLRHELTHALIREIVGTTASVPAWVDEGLATILQDTVVARTSDIDRGPYVALALLAQHQVALDDLSSLAEWPARNSALKGYGYRVAEKAARELLRRVSLPVLRQIFSTQRSLASFAAAYENVTGETYAAFLVSFARQVAACGPAVVTAPVGADRNASYLARGFGPRRHIRFTIDGPLGYHVGFEAQADDYGSYAGTFGSTAPAGRYEIVAAEGTVSSRAVIDTMSIAPAAWAAAPGVCG